MAISSRPPGGNAAQQTGSQPAAEQGRARRRVRGYLIDPRFQLKYTGYLVAVAVLLSVGLGGVLWKTSDDVLAQSRTAVVQGRETVKRGKDLVKTSQDLSKVVQMNIADKYADDPDTAALFTQGSEQKAKELADEQKRLEEEAHRLDRQAQQVEQQQRTILLTLGSALSLLVLVIGLAGIVITHRIVGPVFKMKRLLRQVGTSRLHIKERLRKGDELEDLFDTFLQMTYSLQALQGGRLATLDATIKKAEASQASPEVLQGLKVLRAQLCLGLPSSQQRPALKP